MKFLLDQNLSPHTVLFLKTLGIDAIDVRKVGLSGKEDDEIYAYAVRHKYVIITFDHEFAYRYMFRGDLEGLIIIRLHPQTLHNIHEILKQFFEGVDKDKILKSISVLERGKFRIRKIKGGA